MQGRLALVLAVALVNGLGEELFFRGALFDALGSRNPVASSPVIYVAVTATTGNIALVVAAGVDGNLLHAAAQAYRRDLGIDDDASLLVNPHVFSLSEVRTIESPGQRFDAPMTSRQWCGFVGTFGWATIRLGPQPASTSTGSLPSTCSIRSSSLRPAQSRRRQLLAHLHGLDQSLQSQGGRLLVLQGDPTAVVPQVAAACDAAAVYANADVTPYARQRDLTVKSELRDRPASGGAL